MGKFKGTIFHAWKDMCTDGTLNNWNVIWDTIESEGRLGRE